VASYFANSIWIGIGAAYLSRLIDYDVCSNWEMGVFGGGKRQESTVISTLKTS
jgi:hypothetical protein